MMAPRDPPAPARQEHAPAPAWLRRAETVDRRAGSMRMPRYDPKGKFARAQVLNDAPAEKPGSTENSNGASSHGAAC